MTGQRELDAFDDATPLPAPLGVQADPGFRTGRLPRIEIEGAGQLHDKLILRAGCDSVDTLTTLLAPYVDGETTLFLFCEQQPNSSGRVALEVLCGDQRVLYGIAEVTCVPADQAPLSKQGIRARFLSITPSAAAFMEELIAQQRTISELSANIGDGGRDKTLRMFALSEPAGATRRMFAMPQETDNATRRMNRLDLSTLMGSTFEQLEGWDPALLCRIVADETPTPPPQRSEGPVSRGGDAAAGSTRPETAAASPSSQTERMHAQTRPAPWVKFAVAAAGLLVVIELGYLLLG